jgi:hypothetical protein
LSMIIVGVPYIALAVALDLSVDKHPLLHAFAPWIPITLVFKILFKGEFTKTGYI